MGKSKENHPKKRHGCLGAFVSVLLVIVLICGGLVLAAKLIPVTIDPVDNAEDLAVNSTLSGDWINILLLGADSDAYARSDTMIIASIHSGTGKVKLTSIMRDTYISIDGHGSNKINTAMHFGGVDLALKTVNQRFDMNISKYAMVDFSAFAYIVEAIEGIDVEVTEAEMKSMNELMGDMRVLYPDIDLAKNDLTSYGKVHLDGMQALAFARIRKLDSDYNRTRRQRMAISAIASKMISLHSPSDLYEICQIGMEHVETNLAIDEIIKLGAKVMLGGGTDFEELRIPADGTYSSQRINGMDCLVPDLAANTNLLHTFIYGEQ